MRQLIRWTACAALAALGLAAAGAGESRATVLPGLEWAGGFGRTFLVVAPPDEGGYAFSLAVMRHVRGPLRAGLYAMADDMGSDLGALTDPHDGAPLGPVQRLHRAATGYGVRADAVAPTWRLIAKGVQAEPFATGTAGWYRVQDDRLGTTLARDSGFGWSAGAGFRVQLPGRMRIGPAVRYHRAFNDRVGRWMSWGLDWSWR